MDYAALLAPGAPLTCVEHAGAQISRKHLLVDEPRARARPPLEPSAKADSRKRARPAGDCPVCLERFGADATVFVCGHRVCATCSEGLARVEAEGRVCARRSGITVSCPLCRKAVKVASV